MVIDGGYDLVLDVGANNGQFGKELRAFGYRDRIVSFEPLAIAHARLTSTACNDDKWMVAPRGALGAARGTANIYISGLQASSSLLTMAARHHEAAPGSATIGQEHVEVETIDRLGPALAHGCSKVFLKIDTQGFELEVLKGAEDMLSRIDCVLLELSLVELYAGQPLWREVSAWIEARGFTMTGLNQAFIDPTSFRTLQIDGIFTRVDNQPS
ncbi:FkbM family methyltransferase [Sphingomonas sp.]|uniref:FkbM family methyltransferase n=1 Tax=Sphingomonas sp. TaxID=28214 RepID=UPI003CC5C48D